MTIVTIIFGYVKKQAKIEERIAIIEKTCTERDVPCKKMQSDIADIRDRIRAIEVKTELFWNAIEKEVINILHHPSESERDILLEKLQDKTITLQEMERLKNILSDVVKKKKAKEEVISAVLLIGRLDQLIYTASGISDAIC